MKNAYKLMAAVAVSAFLTISASAFAGDGSTPVASAAAPAKAMHHRHHHHHMASGGQPHEKWMGTNASDYYRHD